MSWQTVLGFEIHIELSTNSKMFCGCPAAHFNTPPNSQVCPVCLGLPGALPVPNAKAIEWCIKLGLALGCKINLKSKFDRKNYFYPDLPKGYQISQYDEPFCVEGNLLGHKIRRVHMEEDTGKLLHQGPETLIDFNRSGVPLVEVVTEADFNDSNDSDNFLKELQQIIRALGISSCDMEKGSMRLEANISVSPDESFPNYKVEIKNVNSFRFVKKAVDFEVSRQIKLLESGVNPVQETRGFKETTRETFSQRVKEEANDYRYFPEPDIPPFEFTQEKIEKWRSELPLLPAQKRLQLIELGLSESYAKIITADAIMYFEFMKNPSKQTADLLINKREARVVFNIPEEKIREVVSKVISANTSIV
ncbi:MAG: Asp-tRNA(Asn)/Glu-tRNA(Gln) amidotransferase subunit GatB, partial [Candidatus Amesbacteria bacterium]|nr:Asp-tRNA(Asn)/Glu-tRNA(Gln) amidotransferase subunit GatB [Candidatus Amesbacteria bacterium]